MKFALFSAQTYDIEAFEKQLAASNHECIFYRQPLSAVNARLAQGCQAVCVFVNDSLDSDCINALQSVGVRYIALRCAGFNNVDREAAYKMGLRIVRVPEYSPHAVAEHSLALILCLNRKLHKAYNRVREGNFSLKGLLGFDLYGKTMGIIGMGRIGQRLSEIMLGLGCSVLAFDPVHSAQWQRRQGFRYVELDQLYAAADIISLNCPLNEDSFHLINADSISLMKKGVMLINTGRGGLIDSKALIDGLKREHIGAVGLDVYEQEDSLFFADHSNDIITDDVLMRLMTFPNVLITGHQAFFTQEAMQKIVDTTLSNLHELETSGSCANEL